MEEGSLLGMRPAQPAPSQLLAEAIDFRPKWDNVCSADILLSLTCHPGLDEEA
jgi:hypothetical protein